MSNWSSLLPCLRVFDLLLEKVVELWVLELSAKLFRKFTLIDLLIPVSLSFPLLFSSFDKKSQSPSLPSSPIPPLNQSMNIQYIYKKIMKSEKDKILKNWLNISQMNGNINKKDQIGEDDGPIYFYFLKTNLHIHLACLYDQENS